MRVISARTQQQLTAQAKPHRESMTLRRLVPLWLVPLTFFSALMLGRFWKRSSRPHSMAPETRTLASTKCLDAVVYAYQAGLVDQKTKNKSPKETAPRKVLIQAPGALQSTSHSKNGHLLLTVAEDQATVWDTHTGAALKSWSAPVGTMMAPFAPDGERVLFIGAEGWATNLA